MKGIEEKLKNEFKTTYTNIENALRQKGNCTFYSTEGLRLVDNEDKTSNYLIPGDLVTIPVGLFETLNMKHYMVYLGKYKIGNYDLHYFLEYNIEPDKNFHVSFKHLAEVIDMVVPDNNCVHFKLRIPNEPTENRIRDYVLNILQNTMEFLKTDTINDLQSTRCKYNVLSNNCETFARRVSSRGEPQQTKLLKNFLNHTAKIFGKKHDSWKSDVGSKGCEYEKTCIYLDKETMTRKSCREEQSCLLFQYGQQITGVWDTLQLTEGCKITYW